MLRKFLLVFGYVCGILAVIAVTVALVAYGNDYAYDFSTHQIIQKGHVIIQTKPNGLMVTADGKTLDKKTPYQAAWSVGLHEFMVTKAGFWPWQKTLDVVAGQVSLADYAILVPKNPSAEVLDSRSQLVTQAMSRDRRHLAYITGGPDGAAYTVDLGNPTPVKVYQPTPAADGSVAETLNGVTWSDDGSHVLIHSTLNGQPEYRLVSAGGGNTVDLTARYQEDFTGLQFSTGSWQQLYWISADDGSLRRLDVGSQSISDVLAAHVTQFWVIPDNRVLYAQTSAAGQSLWSLSGGNKTQDLIPALAPSPSYAVAYASFSGQDELAVVPSATGVGTVYSDIFGDTPVAKTIAHGVSGVNFAPDGHVVAFTAPQLIITYDLNASQIENKLVRYSIADQLGDLSALTWFDNYHLLITRGNQLYWYEFDGANRVPLGTVATDFPAYATALSNPKSLVDFAAAPAGVRITQLTVVTSSLPGL